MLSSQRHTIEAFVGFGWRAMTSKRRECMKRLASSAWPNSKTGPKAISMWFSAKHFQAKKIDRGMSVVGQTRNPGPVRTMSGLPLEAAVKAHTPISTLRANNCREQMQQTVAYSITWSARARIVCGILMPRVRAVLRLTANQNFVGSSIGKSAGFAPLRILSTKSAQRRYSASGSAV